MPENVNCVYIDHCNSIKNLYRYDRSFFDIFRMISLNIAELIRNIVNLVYLVFNTTTRMQQL